MSPLIKSAAIVLLSCSYVGLAAEAAKPRFSYYQMPDTFSGPCDLIPGSDKSIWVQDILDDKIARIGTVTGQVDSYTIPYTNPPVAITLPDIGGRTVLACAIQPGEDGMLYASAGVRNQFVQINPKTKKIKVFTPPKHLLGNLQPFNDLYRAKTGMFLSQTSGNVIQHFDYKTHKFTTYKIPTPDSFPLGVYVSKDGAVWFTEFVANKMGRLNATTGEFKEYPVGLGLSQPAVIRAAKGPYLYFTAATGNAIGRINIYTGALKRYPIPSVLHVPGTDIEDGKGNVWFSSFTKNAIGKLHTKSGKVEVIKTPPSEQTLDPPILTISVTYGNPNSIYFSESSSNQVGAYRLHD